MSTPPIPPPIGPSNAIVQAANGQGGNNQSRISLPLAPEPKAQVTTSASVDSKRNIYPANGIQIDPNSGEKIYPNLGEDLGPGGVRFSNVQEAQKLFFAGCEAKKAVSALQEKIGSGRPVTLDEVLDLSFKLIEAKLIQK